MSTPPTEVPSRRKDERFKEIGAPCEWPELYRPGGYHPVHLGDTFSNGRYRVFRKLGDGSYATVWLAVDNIKTQYVALKIMMAKKSSASANVELTISNRLEAMAPDYPSSKHVMMSLDTFEHDGPNGKHRCFIYEPMGSTVTSMVEKLPWDPPRTFRSPSPHYPKWMAKRILKHALTGLDFLHKNGIVHGDFQPGNLLFSIRGDLNSVDESKLQQNKANITEPIERLDGQIDKWAPKYLVISESLHQYADLTANLEIKISDFGAAFWVHDPPESTLSPVALRAPELIFKEGFDSSIDI
ncbi:uncharacterized protein TRUGW13939_04326 [Talaromyces rugulosus]|uniref:non-specific serine/threonine protein kinase n=1 Tax=Talaromyces rugulosus TaxID=121627 RepID=A0A7H8QTU9_TALRU|nr:uncharacterized protein TRUGW13939_04326 [Talaromyces rugulosus]QKX57218.1 hypothetical protein TRUGW13939_04326 [Talaromyces rugulosus]